MKKLQLSKETLRVLSDQDTENLAGGLPVYTQRFCPSEQFCRMTMAVPTVCHYRDCVAE